MKNILKIALGALFLASTQAAVAAPPTMMLVPDKTWCIEKGYVNETMRNGKKIVREDYDRALVDKDFSNVSLAIKQVFAERGYPIIDSSSQQESDDEDEMFDEAFEGAQTGAGVQTNSFDEILKRNKPDIIIKLGWNENVAGSYCSCDLRIEAVDAYSNKSVAPLSGSTGQFRRPFLGNELKQAAKNNMDGFLTTLQSYFDDVQQNGREMRLILRIVDNGSGLNMNSEFGGEELADIIYNWVNDNSQNHQFTRRSSGRDQANYTQIRVPMKDSTGKPQDAQTWAKGLQKKLQSLGIPTENRPQGLGTARLMLGEK